MAELPTGTVTFVFTDIEGSTRRWERDPAAMQKALQLHDSLLTESFTASGGVTFKHTGDGVCAVFASAGAAVTAAAAAQRAIASADWSSLPTSAATAS